MGDKRRLIALTAEGNRRQIRAIGLHQQAVARNAGGNVAQILGVLVGHHAGERDVQAHLQARLSRGRVACERVHHAENGSVPVEVVAQHAHNIGLGLAAMDDERQLPLA